MTTFNAPLKVKAFRSSYDLSGPAVVSQTATVTNLTSGASSIRLPARSTIIDVLMNVMVSGSGNSQGVACRIGTSTDAVFFGQMIGSAAGVYRAGANRNATTVSAANFKIGAADIQLHLDVSGVTTAAGAVDNFEGILSVFYIPSDTVL